MNVKDRLNIKKSLCQNWHRDFALLLLRLFLAVQDLDAFLVFLFGDVA